MTRLVSFSIFFLLWILQGCGTHSNPMILDAGTGDAGEFPAGEVSRISQPENLPKLSESSTLEDYWKFALAMNAGLQEKEYERLAARWQIPVSGGMPDANINVAGFVQSVETRVGPQRLKVGISQPLPWPGKLKSRADAATEKARVRNRQYDRTADWLIRNITIAWYEYAYLGKAIELTRRNVDLVIAIERVAQQRYEAGRLQQWELLGIQVRLDMLRDSLRTLLEKRAPLSARLDALLNRSSTSLLPFPDLRFRPLDNPPDLGELKRLMVSRNPELAILDAIIQTRDREITVADLSGYPDFRVGMQWVQTDPSDMAGVQDNGKDPLAVSLGMTLPIWRSKYSGKVNRAKFLREAARKKKIDLEKNLESRLSRAIFEMEDAQRKHRLYSNRLLPRARQTVEVIQEAFATGKADYKDFIDAQRNLLELELKLNRAWADYGIALAKIEFLVGTRPVDGRFPTPDAQPDSK